MLISPLVQFIITPEEFHSGLSNILPPTALEYGWEEIVREFTRGDAYACMLVLDRSQASTTVRQWITEHYERLDAATGTDLVLFVPAIPPDSWFRSRQVELAKLSSWSQERIRDNAHALRARDGETWLIDNISSFCSRHVHVQTRFPSLLFFEETRIEGSTDTELVALAYPFDAISTPDELVQRLRYLGELATEAMTEQKTPNAYSKQAYSKFYPFSLHYRIFWQALRQLKLDSIFDRFLKG